MDFGKEFCKISWKKIILGTSDTWSTMRLSHRPSNPVYYIVNWRISNLLSGVCKMSLTRTEQIYQNYSEKVVKRPRSYRLTQKSSINLSINELYNYLANVDKLILSPSNVFDHFLLIYNSSGQLVLKVFKSNKIFLLKDLHDNALWTIQITKNWWALRPTETHVSRSKTFTENWVRKKSFFVLILTST